MFSKQIKIGGKMISNDSPAFIIAEAGVNHNGDLDKAKHLIDVALDAGADAVKFQAFRTEELIIPNVAKAKYQKQTTNDKLNQFEMLKNLELTYNNYEILKKYCDDRGVIFLITPFDLKSFNELEKLGVCAYKIASTDTTNLPLLKIISKTKKPIILSTGMTNLNELEKSVEIIKENNDKLIILQCTANYPINDNEANLEVISSLRSKFNCLVGYSDHSTGIGASPYAAVLGAKILEKHFTLDKTLDGPDHLASLDPEELKSYVLEIRRAETFRGSGIKKTTFSESETRKSLQKCIVAVKRIKKGDIFSEDNIFPKSTGGLGISAIKYFDLLGLRSQDDYEINQIIDDNIIQKDK